MANALTGAAISRVARMEHLDSPTVDCNVLTRDDEDKESENHGDKVDFLSNQ